MTVKRANLRKVDDKVVVTFRDNEQVNYPDVTAIAFDNVKVSLHNDNEDKVLVIPLANIKTIQFDKALLKTDSPYIMQTLTTTLPEMWWNKTC